MPDWINHEHKSGADTRTRTLRRLSKSGVKFSLLGEKIA